MVEAKVIFPYKAVEDDELDLELGEIITNIRKLDGGWWEGELNGKRGVFPDNFVEEIPNIEPSRENKNIKRLSAKIQDDLDFSNMAAGSKVMNRTPSKKAVKQARAEVTFSYTADNEDELNLEIGQMVNVFREVEEGWWEGETADGRHGVFPNNFVNLVEGEVLPEDYVPMFGETTDEYMDMSVQNDVPEEDEVKSVPAVAAECEPENDKDAEDAPPQVKKPIGMGFGNLVNPGMLQKKLKKVPLEPKEEKPKIPTEKDEKIAKVPPVEEKPAPEKSVKKKHHEKRPAPSVPKPDQVWKPPVLKAKVLFAYEPVQDDELGLDVGEIVTVLKKVVSDGWCEGELNGKVGVFPDNFVEFLPLEQDETQKEKPPPVTLPKKPIPALPQTTAKPQLPAVPTPNSVKRQPPPLPEEKRPEPVAEVKKTEEKKASPVLNKKPPPVLPTPEKNTKPPMLPAGGKPPALPAGGKPRPPLPSKKPETPPVKPPKPFRPVHKKHVEEDKHKEAEKGFDFDVIKSQEKLMHLTTDRPKGPSKAPPARFSKGRLSGEILENDIVDAGVSTDVIPDKPSWVKELQNKEVKKPEPVKQEPEPVKEKPKKEEVPIKKNIPERPEPPKAHEPVKVEPEPVKPAATVVSQASSVEVSNNMAKELLDEIKKLKEKVETMEKKFTTDVQSLEKKYEAKLVAIETKLQEDMNDLTIELDEEKKERMKLVVELNRLKREKMRGSRLVGDS